MKTSSNHRIKTLRLFGYFFLFAAFAATGCSQEGAFTSPDLQDEENNLNSLLTRATIETDAFVTEWIVPEDAIINFPLDTTKQYNCIIDWGDNSSLSYIFNKADYYKSRHIYYTPGVYRIKILGNVPQFTIDNNCKPWLSKIIQWGNIHLEGLSSTFSNCYNLVSIPAGIPNLPAFSFTFKGCTSLQSLPDGLFENCTQTTIFINTFGGCSSLTTLPANLFEKCVNARNFTSTFMDCGLTYLPGGLFEKCINVTAFSMTFHNCQALLTLPADLFSTNTEVTNFNMTFYNCNKLTSIPFTLFNHCKKVTDFEYCFWGCSSLTGKTPKTDSCELWERAGRPGFPGTIYGENCFDGCNGLEGYAGGIPKAWGGEFANK